MKDFDMKDPAVLFYINDWLSSTAEMDADVRGWYLNLLLHNYDKKTLPNDVEKLAVLCNVKFSEYERFKQVFEQVLKQKFEQVDSSRISNRKTDTILKARETFKTKRSNAGKKSYIVKYMAENYPKHYLNKKMVDFVKNNFDLNIDLKNEQMIKQVFEQVFELYINENENINIDISSNKHENFKNECLNSKIWQEQVAITIKTHIDNIPLALKKFNEHLITTGENKMYLKDYKTHFMNWFRIIYEKEIKKK